MTRRSRLASLTSIALAIAGCASRSIAVEIDFTPDSLADDATAIELFVVDRCADVTRGEAPSATRASQRLRRDETPRALPDALPERFGVAVIARDEGCAIVGAGCVDTSRDTSSIRVEVTAISGDACDASASCVRGLCETGAIDASVVDAPVEPPDAIVADVTIDATRDVGHDAGRPDAASDAAVEIECNCVDDDADTRIDEGCFESGSGRTLWETVIDGPGEQGLRGAALGGDDRVYLNGWMDTLGASTTLCGDGPWVGVGSGGAQSFIVSLDAATGACVGARENHTDRAPPAPSRFAYPLPSRRGVWIFGGARINEYSETTLLGSIEFSPGAHFDIGNVAARPASSTDLLISWWNNGGAPSLLTTPVGSVTNDPLSIVTGATPVVAASTGVPREVLSGWLDATHVWLVGPRSGGDGFPCTNASAHPTTGLTRVEVRDVAALGQCTEAFGADAEFRGEQAAVLSGSRVWFFSAADGRYVLGALDLTTGDTAHVTLEGTGTGLDTITHLVATAGDTVAIAGSLNHDDGGGLTPHGVLARYALADGEIAEIGRRWIGRTVAGLGVSDDGRTVFTNASFQSSTPRCTGAAVTPVGASAMLVSAIQLEP